MLPAVGDRAARGRVFAAIEVLANVQDLVEWKADVREEELANAAVALTECACRLEAVGLGADATRLREAVAAAERIVDREARGRALDAALVDAVVICDAARSRPGIEDAVGAVRTHLVNEALRAVMRVQRPLLDRISQG